MSGPKSVDPIAEARRQWIAHGWDEAASGMTAVTSIIRAQQLLMARIDRTLRPFSLSFARFELLRLLAFSRDGMLPMASVIARLQVHPTTVTSTVDRLGRDGMVSREQHPEDGRAALLVITGAGRERVEEATLALNDVFADLGMSAGDEAELVRIIGRFRASAGDFGDAPSAPAPR